MKRFNTIGLEEIKAASYTIEEAINNNCPLSGYIGSEDHGGPQCMSLEHSWEKSFKVKHAVAVNSATSGLLAACMAVGVEHGDEVIVSPYTMSATAAAPKLLGAKLVFADIEPETYCLDPLEVSNAFTPRTRAVIVTNLFGSPASLHELRETCDDHGVYLIEDNAQSILATERGVYAGTIGHIGVFSLNVHKHIQVGEGGICVTNIDGLDVRLREAMNHGEMRGGILGLNLRMTEVVASMAREQLKKLEPTVAGRRLLAKKLITALKDVKGLRHIARDDCEHSYYCLALLTDSQADVPPPWRRGYLHPLYSLPALKQNISLPMVEEIERRIILLELCAIDPTDAEIKKMVSDLRKYL